MYEARIRNRRELSSALREAQSTVYGAFDADWSGIASTTMLAAVAFTFNVPLDSLVQRPTRHVRKSGEKR